MISLNCISNLFIGATFGDFVTFGTMAVLLSLLIKKLFDNYGVPMQPEGGTPPKPNSPGVIMNNIGRSVADILDPRQNLIPVIAFIFILAGSVNWPRFPTGAFILLWVSLMAYYNKIQIEFSWQRLGMMIAGLFVYGVAGIGWIIMRYYFLINASENADIILNVTDFREFAQYHFWDSYAHFVYWPFSLIYFVIIDLGRRVYDTLSYQIIDIFARMCETKQKEILMFRNIQK